MSGKKKGNIANPDLHSSESPAKDGNELKNRINNRPLPQVDIVDMAAEV